MHLLEEMFYLRRALYFRNTTHTFETVHVTPRITGKLVDLPAVVRYTHVTPVLVHLSSDVTIADPPSDQQQQLISEHQIRRGGSAVAGPVTVVTRAEYLAFVKSHLWEWSVFFASAILLVWLPYRQYRSHMDSLYPPTRR